MTKTYRVVAWSTGNVGATPSPASTPDPTSSWSGLWVSNPDKVGKDAGELAGLGRTLGVAATDDVEALLALKPDVVVHTAMADHRLMEAIGDMQRILRAGVNVVSSGPVFLQYPYGVVDELDDRRRSRTPPSRAGCPCSSTGWTPGSPTTPCRWC